MTSAARPSPRGPKAQRLGADQILNAAERVFSKDGLEGASVRGIAAEAGCDPSLIYYHFESKEAMFLALLDRCFPVLVADLQELARPEDTRPMPYRLRDILATFHRHIGAHAGLRAVIRGELVRGAAGIQGCMAERIKASAGSVWSMLRQGIERGEVRDDLAVELHAFFLIRLYAEILDVLPTMAPLVSGVPSEVAVARAERAWLETYWRGIAKDPLAPLPTDLFHLS